jgi:hypothetical protein
MGNRGSTRRLILITGALVLLAASLPVLLPRCSGALSSVAPQP